MINAQAKILDNRHRTLLIIGAEAEMELIEARYERSIASEKDDKNYYIKQEQKAERKLKSVNKRIKEVEEQMQGLEFD